MDSFFIKPHCISAYVVDREQRKYLLLRRCDPYLFGTWQMVSGKIEEGETSVEAALREIQEETGICPCVLYSADAIETFYLSSKDAISFIPVFVALVGKVDSVRLSPKEHDAYEWLSLEEAMKQLVWAEQRRILAHIHEQFVLREPSSFLQVWCSTLAKLPSSFS